MTKYECALCENIYDDNHTDTYHIDDVHVCALCWDEIKHSA